MSKLTQSMHFTDGVVVHQLGKEPQMIKYNAYTDPKNIDVDVIRAVLRTRSGNAGANAKLHHHKYNERCEDSVKPCEKYRDGNPVEEF